MLKCTRNHGERWNGRRYDCHCAAVIHSDEGCCTLFVQADKYGVPRICFVNKMDRMGADFFNTVKMIVSNLGATPAVLQVHYAGLFMDHLTKHYAQMLRYNCKQVMASHCANSQNNLAGHKIIAV